MKNDSGPGCSFGADDKNNRLMGAARRHLACALDGSGEVDVLALHGLEPPTANFVECA